MLKIFGVVVIFLCCSYEAKVCEYKNMDVRNTSQTSQIENVLTYTCPGPDDPHTFVECCLDSGQRCCTVKSPMYQIDDRVVMVVALIVISTCLILTIVIIICCFWSRCPMYNTCRVNYLQGDIIAYSKEDDALNSMMPREEKDGHNHYSPNAIKIKPVEDV